MPAGAARHHEKPEWYEIKLFRCPEFFLTNDSSAGIGVEEEVHYRAEFPAEERVGGKLTGKLAGAPRHPFPLVPPDPVSGVN